MPLLLDTSFLIDVQRKDADATALLDRFVEEERSLVVPTVVLAEFLTRSSEPDRDVDRILDTAIVLDFSIQDAKAAGEIARALFEGGTFPGWSDVFIAGVARNHGDLPIVTANTDHFPHSETVTWRRDER